MVRILLALRKGDGRSGHLLRELLERVAYELQHHGSTARPLAKVARALADDDGIALDDRAAAEAALDDLAARTGIFRIALTDEGAVVRPWHRSFQEYLAARHLSTRDGSAEQTVARLLADRPGNRPALVDPKWEGCARFLTGAFGQAGVPKARGWLGELRDRARGERDPKREGRLWGLVAGGLAEYGDEYFEGHALLDEVPRDLVRAFDARGADWPLADRVLALRALGRLGDPRLDVDPWVWVPPRELELGGDRDAFQSLRAHTYRFRGLWVRQWPVTVAEFAAFRTDHPGAGALDWATQCHRRTDPVVGVTWHEARAFCGWAQRRWELPGQGVVDLPTASEWEAVARGDRGGPYPWGDAAPDLRRANHRRALGGTSPVGACPGGHAGGLWGLAGNVWEWTATVWEDEDNERDTPLDAGTPSDHGRDDDNERRDIDSEAPRVLRGGAWNGPARNLRCASRSWNRSGSRYRNIGFRVVCRPSPRSDVVP